jgi:VanZ family protein
MFQGPNARTALIALWGVLLCCVVIGSLLPSGSAVMAAVCRVPVSDKMLHFCAYLALALLPVMGFRDRRKGILAGLSMCVLGILVEAGQHFSPGRTMEVGDVIANGAGVSCGTLLALPVRAWLVLL